MISRIVTRIGNTPFVRNAIAEKADLTAFKQKPSARILLGVFLIGFSYVIGWPAVGALAALAIYLEEPLVAIIGGPVTYGLSHLVFLAGMVLAGAKYSGIFLRWATRVVMEKLMQKYT
jgi:energy-converting hydrogenase Eha subunit B